MATYRFTSNVPTKVVVKYLDAVGGQYGPQLRIKGTFTTEGVAPRDEYAYLPGDIADVCNELLRAGVIKEIPDVFPEEGGKAITVKPVLKEFMLVADQPAGQKYQTTRIVTKPSAAAAAPQAPPAPAQQYAETGAPPASAAPAPRATTSHAVGQPGTQAQALDTTGKRTTYSNALYANIIEFVTDEIVPRVQNGAGLRMTPEAIVAAAATLFIQEMKGR
jgi:hypothetical protein